MTLQLLLRPLAFAVCLLTVVGCAKKVDQEPIDLTQTEVKEVIRSGNTIAVELDLDSLFESYDVQGTIIIKQADSDTMWVHNIDRAREGFLPASTFKIVNTLIGLETGVVNIEDTLFLWDGKKRRLPSWESDMTLSEAFHTSCVPCYQEVARKIGSERMNAYLSEFAYGKMVVSDNTIDDFWLRGPSTITAGEQLKFLQKVVSGGLPVSSSSIDGLKDIMLLVEADTYSIYGKTGWSTEGRRNIGWFVGWYTIGDAVYLFSLNIEPLGKKVPEGFASARHKIVNRVMRSLVSLGQ